MQIAGAFPLPLNVLIVIVVPGMHIIIIILSTKGALFHQCIYRERQQSN